MQSPWRTVPATASAPHSDGPGTLSSICDACVLLWNTAGAQLLYYCSLFDKSYPTLLQPQGLYSPPVSSLHGFCQARILEWVAISFSRGSSRPRDWTHIPCIARRFSLLSHQGNRTQLILGCYLNPSLVQPVKVSTRNAGDLGSIPGSGRSPGEGNGTPLQYSCLENPMDGGAWWVTAMGSQRVGHNWTTSLPICLLRRTERKECNTSVASVRSRENKRFAKKNVSSNPQSTELLREEC